MDRDQTPVGRRSPSLFDLIPLRRSWCAPSALRVGSFTDEVPSDDPPPGRCAMLDMAKALNLSKTNRPRLNRQRRLRLCQERAQVRWRVVQRFELVSIAPGLF